MEVRPVKVTPRIAKDWLAKNLDNNRPTRERVIDKYAADMTEGLWKETGETIKFNVEGKLIDGQHRLHAIIKSKQTMTLWVAYGLPIESFTAIDTGSSRRFADLLHFEGTPYGIRVGGIVKWVDNYENGNPMNYGGTRTASSTQLWERFRKDETHFIEAAKHASDLKRVVDATLAGGMAYYLFNKIDEQTTHAFFESLKTGANLNGKSPILVLRNRLISQSKTGERLNTGERLSLYIRAWNNYIRDTPVSVLYQIGTDRKKLGNNNFPRIDTVKQSKMID